MRFAFVVRDGNPSGLILDFPLGEYVIGRGPECHVRANTELLERQHCLLVVNGDRVALRDLVSTTGTLVNGQRLVGERPLGDGDLVQLGLLVLEARVSNGAR